MDERFEPQELEKRWQKKWEEEKVFAADRFKDREPFYVLEMFPYPSGNLHMGHVSCYSIGDVVARYKRLKGFNVLHPMGWDALGLPAENAALQDGIHPRERTLKNIESVKAQMIQMGFSYDWDREVTTCEPEYYRWNQWFFEQMYKKGLVYRRKSWVNWCPHCDTVLANEQVEGGTCWRCSNEVTQKLIPEWAFKITDYAQELLDDLELLENWPERITTAQRNWIGRSTGAEVIFKLADREGEIPIYTTRVDTIFGCTYVVLAPEHELALELTTDEYAETAKEFIERMKRTSKLERTAEGGVKEGVFTGSYAINPYNGEKVPIWLANFVLAEYGTGAVMSVPAHDQRDFEFAHKYDIPIRSVIRPKDGEEWNDAELSQAFTEYGVLYNSGDYSGLTSEEARKKMAEDAEKGGFGKPTVNFRLRDWGFSRQRYWGTPIPVLYDKEGNEILVPEDQLPVELPEKAILRGEGLTPLGRDPEFVNTTHPETGEPVTRETETMDTFVDSSWYYARFLSPKNDKEPFEKEEARRWLPVDVYVGGPEHAVMHLLYFRFWHKVMRDLGLTDYDEPVNTLITQGMVVDWSYKHPETKEYFAPSEVVWDESLGDANVGPADKKGTPVSPKDGVPLIVQIEKMGKSKKNGVSPDEMCQIYGADTLRLFVLFASPPEKDVEWSETGVKGAHRFIARVWRFFHNHLDLLKNAKPYIGLVDGQLPEDADAKVAALKDKARELNKMIHKTIQRATNDIEKRYHFNTAIAALMELVNYFYSLKIDPKDELMASLLRDGAEALVIMLSPFAPHISEELWNLLGHDKMIADDAHWPVYHEKALVEDTITIVIQVNGKVRGKINIPPDSDKEAVFAAAKEKSNIQKFLSGKEIKREIYVPKRLVNFVVK